MIVAPSRFYTRKIKKIPVSTLTKQKKIIKNYFATMNTPPVKDVL